MEYFSALTFYTMGMGGVWEKYEFLWYQNLNVRKHGKIGIFCFEALEDVDSWGWQ